MLSIQVLSGWLVPHVEQCLWMRGFFPLSEKDLIYFLLVMLSVIQTHTTSPVLFCPLILTNKFSTGLLSIAEFQMHSSVLSSCSLTWKKSLTFPACPASKACVHLLQYSSCGCLPTMSPWSPWHLDSATTCRPLITRLFSMLWTLVHEYFREVPSYANFRETVSKLFPCSVW